jgi:hypothetical protein
MNSETIFIHLVEAAAHTIIERLISSGMTEEQTGAWLFNHREQAIEWAMELLQYSTTPEFKQAILARVTK